VQIQAKGETVTGKPYENGYMAAIRFKERKVVHSKQMMDLLYASKGSPHDEGGLPRGACAEDGAI